MFRTWAGPQRSAVSVGRRGCDLGVSGSSTGDRIECIAEGDALLQQLHEQLLAVLVHRAVLRRHDRCERGGLRTRGGLGRTSLYRHCRSSLSLLIRHGPTSAEGSDSEHVIFVC